MLHPRSLKPRIEWVVASWCVVGRCDQTRQQSEVGSLLMRGHDAPLLAFSALRASSGGEAFGNRVGFLARCSGSFCLNPYVPSWQFLLGVARNGPLDLLRSSSLSIQISERCV